MCAAQSRDWMGIEMVNSEIQAGRQQCLLCQIPIRLDSECQYIYHLTKTSGKEGKLHWYVRECCTIWPAHCFCLAPKQRMLFTFLNGWGKVRR